MVCVQCTALLNCSVSCTLIIGLFKTVIFLFHNFLIITVQLRFIGDCPHLRDPYEDKYIEVRYKLNRFFSLELFGIFLFCLTFL